MDGGWSPLGSTPRRAPKFVCSPGQNDPGESDVLRRRCDRSRLVNLNVSPDTSKTSSHTAPTPHPAPDDPNTTESPAAASCHLPDRNPQQQSASCRSQRARTRALSQLCHRRSSRLATLDGVKSDFVV